MRTEEQFSAVMNDLKWYHNFHKKAVWLVALEDKYCLSAIKPRPEELAKGTVANLYNADMQVIDYVYSSGA